MDVPLDKIDLLEGLFMSTYKADSKLRITLISSSNIHILEVLF